MLRWLRNAPSYFGVERRRFPTIVDDSSEDKDGTGRARAAEREHAPG
jgi:hypothetical protein